MKALTKVFQQLRKQGFVAQQSYKCCMTCALSGFETELRPKQKTEPKGFVYYHRQDADALKDRFQRYERSTTCPSLSLRFTSVDGTGRATKKVGKAVLAILDEHKVPYEWDGDPNRVIEVYPFGKTKAYGDELKMLEA